MAGFTPKVGSVGSRAETGLNIAMLSEGGGGGEEESTIGRGCKVTSRSTNLPADLRMR